MLTLCLWYLAPTPQCLPVTRKSGSFSWIGGGGGAGLSCGCWMQGELWNYIYHHAPTDERDGWMSKKWSSGGKDT